VPGSESQAPFRCLGSRTWAFAGASGCNQAWIGVVSGGRRVVKVLLMYWMNYQYARISLWVSRGCFVSLAKVGVS